MFPVLSQYLALWMLWKHIDNEELTYHHRHYNCHFGGGMVVSYVHFHHRHYLKWL